MVEALAIELHGGDSNFESKLDQLFETSSSLSGRQQSDITGLIGQYAHGNEPSHHMAYLYNFVGKPHKTQQRVYQIMSEQYSINPDGLSGNEDCGQMSSWYVLSALGFYSVVPGMPYYSIGTPIFNQATINLENGKTFKVHVERNKSDDIFIDTVLYYNYSMCVFFFPHDWIPILQYLNRTIFKRFYLY